MISILKEIELLMTITEVKIRRLYNQERLKALVSVTFDDALVILNRYI